MLAVLVGVEVKLAYGDETEAKVQLAVWISAGVQHRRELATAATGSSQSMDSVPLFGWTVIGHRWELYIGSYGADGSGDIVC